MDVDDKALRIHFWNAGGDQVPVHDLEQARRHVEYHSGSVLALTPFLKILSQVGPQRNGRSLSVFFVVALQLDEWNVAKRHVAYPKRLQFIVTQARQNGRFVD